MGATTQSTILGDITLNGTINLTDINLINGNYGTRGWQSISDVDNRKGYAGYELDDLLVAAASLYHVRNRVLHADLGRWLRRDPLGYVDGVNLYEYCSSSPSATVDSTGLFGGCYGLWLAGRAGRRTPATGATLPGIRIDVWSPDLFPSLDPCGPEPPGDAPCQQQLEYAKCVNEYLMNNVANECGSPSSISCCDAGLFSQRGCQDGACGFYNPDTDAICICTSMQRPVCSPSLPLWRLLQEELAHRWQHCTNNQPYGMFWKERTERLCREIGGRRLRSGCTNATTCCTAICNLYAGSLGFKNLQKCNTKCSDIYEKCKGFHPNKLPDLL
jgi:RHS repeat-associated protein